MTTQRGYSAGRRRREEILRAAADIVEESGHLALTVRQVAERIGVTDTAVFYHFPTKDVLLVELLRHREDRSVEAELDLDVIDTIAIAVANSQSTPNYVALFADLASRAIDPGHPAHSYFDERYRAIENAVVLAVMARMPDAGEELARELAQAYIAVTDGLQRHWLVRRDIDMGAAIRRASMSLFGTSAHLAPPPALSQSRSDSWGVDRPG